MFFLSSLPTICTHFAQNLVRILEETLGGLFSPVGDGEFFFSDSSNHGAEFHPKGVGFFHLNSVRRSKSSRGFEDLARYWYQLIFRGIPKV